MCDSILRHIDLFCKVIADGPRHQELTALLSRLRAENGARDRVVFCVAEGDERRSHTTFCGKSFGGSRKKQKGFAALFFADVNVAPAHRFAYSGTERFCHCLFPAKRAARCRSGNFMDIEYSISPSVKTRFRNRSPNRSMECRMREHSIRSTPIPMTLMRNCHRVEDNAIHLGHSFGIICHSGEHFLDRRFQANPHRARYDGVTNVQFGQIRNLVDERDVL